MMKCITFPKELSRCTFQDIDPSQFAWVHDLRDFAGYNRIADGAKGCIASMHCEIASAPYFSRKSGMAQSRYFNVPITRRTFDFIWRMTSIARAVQ